MSSAYVSLIFALALLITVAWGLLGGIWYQPFCMSDKCHLAVITVHPALAKSGDHACPLACLHFCLAHTFILVIVLSIELSILISLSVQIPVWLHHSINFCIHL